MASGFSTAGFLASRQASTALALLPIVAPVAYVLYMNWTVKRNTFAVNGKLPNVSSSNKDDQISGDTTYPQPPQSLPADITADVAQWVVAYERVVSHPISISTLSYQPSEAPVGTSSGTTQPSSLLRSWLRVTHKAFSWTPQAFIIRAVLKEPLNRGSFDGAWIDSLMFKEGDVVNGVYRVSCHQRDATTGSERAELVIDVPQSYKGPPVRGLILSAIEPVQSSSSGTASAGEPEVVFVNETWMWRLNSEKPTLLESGFGRWFHRLLAGWLIMKGLNGVQRGRKSQ